MRKAQIHFILWLMVILFPATLQAQKMTVESMVSTPLDQTANLAENLHVDNNGDYGGLVKVLLASPNAEFEGWILDKPVLHGSGEYWVFMAKGSDRLTVRMPGYLPLKVSFRDYEDCIIKSKQTYVLTITLPQMEKAPVDNGLRYLVMTLEPKNCTVLVDGTPQGVDGNGEMMVTVPKGKHTYQVMAPGYATQQGEVVIGDEKATLTVTLESLMATLRVECATEGVQIYIDDKLQGTAPWQGILRPGNYQLEARCDGYRPIIQGITLGEKENRTVQIPALSMIVGTIDVRVTPVNAEVLIDGKVVGTTPDVFRNVMVGNRSVEVRKDGYQPLKKTVAVREDEQASVTGMLTENTSTLRSCSFASGPGEETFTVNGVSFTMIRVEGGTFTMGSVEGQDAEAFDREMPAHQVTLSDYSIGETEVTQALWRAVMGYNPSKNIDDGDRPVEQVSWDDCQTFIGSLNVLTGRQFRLPTEAEWEYAARGGNRSRGTKYAGGNDIESVAWYDKNAGSGVEKDGPDYGTHPVKTKAPNELGLYDMSGNVWEMCQDRYGSYKRRAQENPKGPSSGATRVNRGGSCDFSAIGSRVTYRNYFTPDLRSGNLGFRLAF